MANEFLSRGIEQLGLPFNEAGREKLLSYLQLLDKWNRIYNLTGQMSPDQMVAQHLLDSLAAAEWLRGPRVLDVGTGAGLPGIPLAIARPELTFVLLDSQQKKTRFVRQAVIELGLANVDVVQARAGGFQPALPFDTVIARAFAALADFVREVAHLCHPDGQILAMKGRWPESELKEIPEPYRVVAVTKLTVPGLHAERHLVRLQRTDGGR